MNQHHLDARNQDSELAARIASYELAFRMQMSAPEATDISGAIAEMNHFGLTPAMPFAVATILLELGASVLILTGFYRWLGALALAGFTLTLLGIGVAYACARLLGLTVGTGLRTFALTTGIANYGYLPLPLMEAMFGPESRGILLVHNVGVEAAIWTGGILVISGLSPREGWRRMINANCFGVLYCTHAALPLLGEAGGGDIVNVSSVAGRQASLGSAAYNMTKWGVNGFTEALRQEALHAGVRVSVIEPGMVETELLDHNKNPMVLEAAKKMREQVGKPLSADDIARAILYIVSQPEHVAINEVLVRPTRQSR